MPHNSNGMRINGQILTVLGTPCDEIESLAPFPGTMDSNSTEAFRFDLTGGVPGGPVLHTLVPPGIPRGQPSLRLCIEDKELAPVFLAKSHRFALNPLFTNLTQLFLLFLPPDPQGLALTYASDDEHWEKIFLGENVTLSAIQSIRKLPGQEYEPPPQDAFMAQFALHFLSYRHFYTRKGYLGYGPSGLQEGDLVCVLPKCLVPLILRKVGDYYHFVSTCFVLGLMDEEAAEMLERGESVLQEFNIC